ncbi:hypothetical protein SGLAU_01705 [Streptomyces glaucescens]|uniref:Uncharacterized protein n=1 Tax=Streptomyces glaucescens TaxID=1907 RepID=A0A089X5R2_STRGA|nr:hypothetical protein SGLAU_01705 [Streptomyces glaucescens]
MAGGHRREPRSPAPPRARLAGLPAHLYRARLNESVHRLVADARQLGLTDQELLTLVRDGLSGTPGAPDGPLP